MTMKTWWLKAIGFIKSSSKKKVYSNTILPQEIRKKNWIENLTLHLWQLEKEKRTHTHTYTQQI